MAKLDTKSRFTGIFGFSAAGAGIGAIAGIFIGIGAAALLGLPPILDWYRAQPEGWGIVTFPAAAIAFLAEAAFGAAIGAIVCALAGAGISMLISSFFLARQK